MVGIPQIPGEATRTKVSGAPEHAQRLAANVSVLSKDRPSINRTTKLNRQTITAVPLDTVTRPIYREPALR